MVIKAFCNSTAGDFLAKIEQEVEDPIIERFAKLCQFVGHIFFKVFNYCFHQDIGIIDAIALPQGPQYERGYKKYDQGFGVQYNNVHPNVIETEGQVIDNITFTAVNGAGVTHDWALTNAEFFSKVILDDIKFTFIVNPTLGFVRDLYRYAIETFSKCITPSSILLRNEWEQKLDLNPDEQIIHLCHSEGSAITRNALLITRPELRERIHVLSIAPGCYIDKGLCARIKYIVSLGDIVPYFDLEGMIRSKDDITFVLPKINELDHIVYNQTYQNEMQQLVDSYIQNIQSTIL